MMIQRIASLVVLVTALSVTKPTNADIVTVLFTGFLSPVPGSGMEALDMTLSDLFATEFPDLNYSGQAFEYTQKQDALDFINSFDEIDRLYLAGHSFGGSSLIQLAENMLAPLNMSVDLTFQIDSVDNFLGPPPDDVLPDNVKAGYNYYQISTGGIFEPQGEMFVAGAININVEILFNDPSITHTSIDDDPRLHNEIFNNMKANIIPEPTSTAVMGIGVAFVLLCSRRRAAFFVLNRT